MSYLTKKELVQGLLLDIRCSHFLHLKKIPAEHSQRGFLYS